MGRCPRAVHSGLEDMLMTTEYIWTTRPRTELEDDLFGHAIVLKSLVQRVTTSADERLFAIFAPWGCGKSTALQFCQHIHNEQLGSAGGVGTADKTLWLPQFET